MPGGLITLDTYDSCQRTPRTVLLGVRRISSLILMARDLSIEPHLDGCYSLWALAYSLSQWMNYFNVCTSSHGFLLRRLDSIRCTRVSLTTDDCSWANRELEKLIRSPTKPAVIDMGKGPAMAGTLDTYLFTCTYLEINFIFISYTQHRWWCLFHEAT